MKSPLNSQNFSSNVIYLNHKIEILKTKISRKTILSKVSHLIDNSRTKMRKNNRIHKVNLISNQPVTSKLKAQCNNKQFWVNLPNRSVYILKLKSLKSRVTRIKSAIENTNAK